MTIKSFSFQNIEEKDADKRNWRQFQDNSTFRVWTPTARNITNLGNTKGYYQLYGPLVYYYIHLEKNGGGNMVWSGVGNPDITPIPYGPNSVSGSKATPDVQYLNCNMANGYDLVNNQKAIVTAVGGVQYIILPNGAVWAGATDIYIYGWIFRDA